MPIAPRNPPSILDKIMAQRRLDVEAAQLKVPADELKKRIAARAPALDFAATVRAAASPLCLLAEMKRASPSKGDIATGIDAPQQALAYTTGLSSDALREASNKAGRRPALQPLVRRRGGAPRHPRAPTFFRCVVPRGPPRSGQLPQDSLFFWVVI